jgi:redox-sensitive bicupin YhaK (pirin superfamily)
MGQVTVAPPALVAAREVPLGGVRSMSVRRTLPHRDIRTIGAWCFVDHYGPQSVGADGRGGMQVPPHPHIGLQTVTWLLSGHVVHDDSVGSHQQIRPGELNLMTAGHGIAHAEQSAPGEGGDLHGLQLWVALPEESRHQTPHFEHHAQLPTGTEGTVTTTVLIGGLGGVRSPAETYTPLLGAVLELASRGRVSVRLHHEFEHGVLSLDGPVSVDGHVLERSALLGLPPGRTSLLLAADQPARILLLGGEPFKEDLVMWWNFVGRSHDDIAEARADWESERRFGSVTYPGARLPAPPLPTTRLVPRSSGGLSH